MSSFYFQSPYRSTAAVSKPIMLQAWLPVLFCACVFALESTRFFGVDHTSGPLHTAAQYFMGDAANNGWTFIHHYIRKTGHFTGYGLLSVVCFRGFWMTLRNTASRMKRTLGSHGLALAATLFVASADEIHQTFLPNRTGTFSDVVLDTSGGLAFQITLFLILLAAHTWSSQRSSRRDDDFEDTPIKIRRRLVLRRPTPRTFRMAIWNHHFQTLSHRIFTSHNQR